jgi:hypothetical protein
VILMDWQCVSCNNRYTNCPSNLYDVECETCGRISLMPLIDPKIKRIQFVSHPNDFVKKMNLFSRVAIAEATKRKWPINQGEYDALLHSVW